MIIFFNRETGLIVGTIDARVHSEQHLKMWVGSEQENDRLVVSWEPIEKGSHRAEKTVYEPTGGFDEQGNPIFTQVKKEFEQKHVEWEPQHEQKELFVELGKNSSLVYQYKVNTETKTLEAL